MRKIVCTIGGSEWTLVAHRNVPITKRKLRPPEAFVGRATKIPNRWPWRLMRAGESVLIPWGHVTVADMINSVNGYCQNAQGATFCLRSTPIGLRVWCKKQSERNTK